MNTKDEWDPCHSCAEAQPLFRPFPRKWSGILEGTWKVDCSYYGRRHQSYLFERMNIKQDNEARQ